MAHTGLLETKSIAEWNERKVVQIELDRQPFPATNGEGGLPRGVLVVKLRDPAKSL